MGMRLCMLWSMCASFSFHFVYIMIQTIYMLCNTANLFEDKLILQDFRENGGQQAPRFDALATDDCEPVLICISY